MDWTTDIGTFTQTPQPSDTRPEAVLWAISPSGDSTIGWVCCRNGTSFGYLTEDLTRVIQEPLFGPAHMSINDAGDIAGFKHLVTDPDRFDRAYGFLFHDGAYYPIDFPGAQDTRVWGMNNARTLVGSYRYHMPGIKHMFIYADGEYTAFDLPDSFGACSASPGAINSQGAIVGGYQVARPLLPCGGPSHGFVRDADGTTFRSFDPIPGAISGASGINDHGDIVGSFTIDGKTHGYLLPGNGDPAITIDVPNATETDAYGIDNSGKIIVGYFADLSGRFHPFKLTLCGAHCGQVP